MASADLSLELECPICLDIYTDPVHLRCGHNFCQSCISRVLDIQEGAGVYTCPECREDYMERPALQRNIALRNIAERFRSPQPDQEEAGVCCTYCVDSPVPAVMSCLMCDTSLCDEHLRVPSKAPEHMLCTPVNLESRKCSVHKEILKYYCTEDSTCVCVACYTIGGHVGHKMLSLVEASEQKKQKLRNILQKLMAEIEETEKRVWRLQESKRNAQEKGSGETESVTALFRDLRRQLKIKKEMLSRKMRHIEELCNMADPLTVLQEAATDDLCDTEEGDNEDRERHDEELHDGGDLDVAAISHTFHTDLSDMSVVIVQERPDTPAPQHTSKEDKVPITAVLSRSRPQPSPKRVRPQPKPTRSRPQPSSKRVRPQLKSTRSRPQPSSKRVRPQPKPTRSQPSPKRVRPQPKQTRSQPSPKRLHLQPTPTRPHSQHSSKRLRLQPRPCLQCNTTIPCPQPTPTRPQPQSTLTLECTQHQGEEKTIGAVQQTSGQPVWADILLDVATAGDYLHISEDGKSASRPARRQNRPVTEERFQYVQVMSSQNISSGRHYWEVDVGGSVWWKVGMCYPSIARRGRWSVIGCNDKSWCLQRRHSNYLVTHNWRDIQLPDGISSGRVRIDLDYEAGQISFYDLCDPIRLLHTFTTTFTEPLHAAVWLYDGSLNISGRDQER